MDCVPGSDFNGTGTASTAVPVVTSVMGITGDRAKRCRDGSVTKITNLTWAVCFSQCQAIVTTI